MVVIGIGLYLQYSWKIFPLYEEIATLKSLTAEEKTSRDTMFDEVYALIQYLNSDLQETNKTVVMSIQQQTEQLEDFVHKLREFNNTLQLLFDNDVEMKNKVKLVESAVNALSVSFDGGGNKTKPTAPHSETFIYDANASASDCSAEYTQLKTLLEKLETDAASFKIQVRVLEEQCAKSAEDAADFHARITLIQYHTFNKGAVIAAFMLLVLIVLMCAAALYRLYCKLESCQQDLARLKPLEIQCTQWLKADNSSVVTKSDKSGVNTTAYTDKGEDSSGCEVDGLTPRTVRHDESMKLQSFTPKN